MRTKIKTNESTLEQITQSLREQPELADRVLSIMKLANEPLASGKIRRADEVETLLIEELRKLGNETLSNWGKGVNETVGEALRAEEPDVRMREKKLKMVESLRISRSARESLAQCADAVYPASSGCDPCVATVLFIAVAACDRRLWF